jgi:hypothetical protein
MTKLADLKLSIPLDAIDLDRVLAFCVRAFVVDAEEVIHVENDHPNPDGFGVYALYWGEMQHIADRKSPEEAEKVCAFLRDILAEKNPRLQPSQQEGDLHAKNLT